MKGADYIAETLARHGVKDVFLITGGACAFMVDAIGRHPDMRYFCFQHEQAAAMAADAVWRVDGSMGATMSTSGPGATNLLTGIRIASEKVHAYGRIRQHLCTGVSHILQSQRQSLNIRNTRQVHGHRATGNHRTPGDGADTGSDSGVSAGETVIEGEDERVVAAGVSALHRGLAAERQGDIERARPSVRFSRDAAQDRDIIVSRQSIDSAIAKQVVRISSVTAAQTRVDVESGVVPFTWGVARICASDSLYGFED